MSLTVFLAVLAAAAMHAIWNALVKVRLDRFMSITLMTLGMGAAALLALPFVDFPKAEGVAVHRRLGGLPHGLQAFLIGAYRGRRPRADLSAGARARRRCMTTLGGSLARCRNPGADCRSSA